MHLQALTHKAFPDTTVFKLKICWCTANILHSDLPPGALQPYSYPDPQPLIMFQTEKMVHMLPMPWFSAPLFLSKKLILDRQKTKRLVRPVMSLK